MKAYKVELLIIDHDGVGDDISSIIENANYPNDCISPKVMEIQSCHIGAWRDDHPLNSEILQYEFYKALFPS